MSQSEKAREFAGEAPPQRTTPAGTRVDTAHLRAGEVPPAEPAPAPRVEIAAAEIVQQVRSQAAQLAAHLQRQQAAIDHRESELNARNAAFDNQVRSARLWLNERHGDLADREAELDRQEKELAKREAELVLQAGPALTQPINDTAAAPGSAESAAEFDRRQAELGALAQRLADRLMRAEQVEDTQQALRTLEKRRDHLDRAEKLLMAEQAQLERQRQQFAEERASHAEHVDADRQKLLQEQQRAIAEHDQARRELARQCDEVSSRQTVLERMRADLARGQQESLEMRLATEELWARLCGTMAPAALTQSLAQIRLKLAEEHRLVKADLAEQRAEIHALSGRLAEQHKKFAQQRDDLQNWATERQRELEKQAGILATAQQKMDEERAAFQEKTRTWQNERFQLQQEIRRLLRQANRNDSVAA